MFGYGTGAFQKRIIAGGGGNAAITAQLKLRLPEGHANADTP
jgi:hypothetical protein